ncbi:hypothetical protein GGF37_002642 [Kickxella alabastrina]|nr:hypothetical protein GGF37_002642 [Kickxella alabastrina]
MPLDPRGKTDAIMLVVITTVYSLSFLAVFYLLWNRNYPPLRAKSPVLMALIMAVAVLWFVGDIQTHGHIPLANTPLVNCKAFGIWLRILLGSCGLCSLISLRAHGLHRVFFLHKPYHSLGLYVPFAIYWVCVLIFGLISQFMKPAKTVQYIAKLDMCRFEAGYKAALFSFLWLTFFIVMVTHWRIRNIKSSFNEKREMIIACTTMFIIFVYVTIMNYLLPKYPLNVHLRIVNTSIDHIAINSLWWLIMGLPLFKSVFSRQQYLYIWINKLRKDGLQKEYDIDSDVTLVNEHRYSYTYDKRKSQMLLNTTGIKDDRAFYAMDNNFHNSKDADFRESPCSEFFGTPDGCSLADQSIAYGQAAWLPAAEERHQEDILMEAVTELSDVNHGCDARTISRHGRSHRQGTGPHHKE